MNDNLINIINSFDKEYHNINKKLNCFTSNLSDFARVATQKASPKDILYGKLIAIKDNINIKNYSTTCASQILEGHTSLYNATVINRLLNVNAAIISKTNMDEFAMGSSYEHSIFVPGSNPLNTDKVAGGSSGGSAAAVASGAVDIALGSDTGGSVRQPAAFCGVYGLKPTYGRISRYGLTAFASSLDQIGIFANNIDDIVDTFSIIGGHDIHDSNTSDLELNCIYKNIDIHKMKIGYSSTLMEKMSPQMKSHYHKLIQFFESQNIQTKDIHIDLLDLAIPTYYIIATAEASSNLSRFDGVRYGKQKASDEVNKLFFNTRTQFFGDEVKRRIMLGTYVLSSGYYEAYYKKALKIRKMITNNLNKSLTDIDVLIVPTTPTEAFNKGEKLKNSLEMYLSDIFTVPFSLSGLPAMSVPIGSINNLPIGAQLCANYFDENKIFALSHFIKTHFTN